MKVTPGNTSPPAVLLASQMEQSWVAEVAVGIALPYAGAHLECVLETVWAQRI